MRLCWDVLVMSGFLPIDLVLGIYRWQKWNQRKKLHNYNTGKYILRSKIKKFGATLDSKVCRKCSEDVNRSSAELPGATLESVNIPEAIRPIRSQDQRYSPKLY